MNLIDLFIEHFRKPENRSKLTPGVGVDRQSLNLAINKVVLKNMVEDVTKELELVNEAKIKAQKKADAEAAERVKQEKLKEIERLEAEKARLEGHINTKKNVLDTKVFAKEPVVEKTVEETKKTKKTLKEKAEDLAG